MNKPFRVFTYRRNDPCYCQSGKKYKVCHLYLEQGYEKTGATWKKKVVNPIAPKIGDVITPEGNKNPGKTLLEETSIV